MSYFEELEKMSYLEERVCRVLLDAEFITKEDLARARRVSEETGRSLYGTLVDNKSVDRETIMTVMSFQLRTPVADLRYLECSPEALRLVPRSYARENRILPYGFDPDGSLRIATEDPTNTLLSGEITARTGRNVRFALALSGDIERSIEQAYSVKPI